MLLALDASREHFLAQGDQAEGEWSEFLFDSKLPG
jgi:hypothetical protein